MSTGGPLGAVENHPEETVERISDRATRIKRRELRTAFARLEARGELTPEQRNVLEAMADRIVATLLASPAHSLLSAAPDEEAVIVETALRLFGDET